MRTLAKLFVCAQLFSAAGATAQVPRVLGIWELDPNASNLPNGFPVASETRNYDLRDDDYLVNLVIRKASDGHPDFIQVVSKNDGKDYPQYQSFICKIRRPGDQHGRKDRLCGRNNHEDRSGRDRSARQRSAILDGLQESWAGVTAGDTVRRAWQRAPGTAHWRTAHD